MACLFAGSASAATINVPADQGTVQAAIDAASDGDTVLVAPGTYYEKLNFNGKAITVKSSGGAAVTILDGNNGGPIVTFHNNEGNTSVLQGFTLTHGFTISSDGSAVQLSGSAPTIIDNRFIANAEDTGEWGAAIGGEDSSPVILRNYFSQNTCGSQFADSVVGLMDGSPVIADNMFVNNPCPALVLIEENRTAPEVYNNTFVGNRAGLLMNNWFQSTGTRFSNNLIAFNQYGLESYAGLHDGPLPSWNTNLVYGNTMADYHGFPNRTASDGNISSDPLFRNWTHGDLSLVYGSPAIDAGGGASSQVSTTDFYGNPRLFAGRPGDSAKVDIGAVEYEPPVVTASDGTLNTTPDRTIGQVIRSPSADPGEPLNYSVLTHPQHGTVSVSGGLFRYTPAAGYVGADSFTFALADPYGAVSNAATEQVTVTDVPAKVLNGSFVARWQIRHKGLSMVRKAYPEQTLTFSLVSPPQHGIVALDNQAGVYFYRANRGFRGQDSFSIQVTDQYGTASNVATITATVR